MDKTSAREIVYGMPYDVWRTRYQKEASPDKIAEFDKKRPDH